MLGAAGGAGEEGVLAGERELPDGAQDDVLSISTWPSSRNRKGPCLRDMA